MKIAFIGKAGSGKTSAALYLTMKHGFYKLAFADELKYEVMRTYEIPREVVFINKPPRIRKALQDLGMKRRLENPAYWINKVNKRIDGLRNNTAEFVAGYNIFSKKKALRMIDLNVVIDDMRFINEEQWAKTRGFKIVKLIRKGEFEAAGMDEESKKHVSEHEWKTISPDYTIESGSFDELFPKLDEMVEMFQKGMKCIIDEIPSVWIDKKSLQIVFEKRTGKHAIWLGKETNAFKEWVKKGCKGV